MKYIKIFRTLAAAIILSLLVVAIPATPAQAQAQAITLSTYSGAGGTTVYVNGSSFTPSTTVYLFFGFQPVTSFNTGTGTFSIPFTIPTGIPPGFYTVTVQDNPTYGAGTILATTSFTVTARQITINPTSGYVGSTVTVSGSGFNFSSTVTIYFDTTAVGTVTATTYGSFSSATFTVPESYRGTHTIKGSDTSGDSPGVTFTTLPKIAVTPTSGTAGDQLTISGTGFAGTSNITFYWDNTLVSASAATNANGSFTNNTFTIPASSRGSHTIKAQDASANYATAPFTIGQKIIFTPTSGASGTTVTVSGSGFEASKNITITFAGSAVTTNPASVTTDSQGSFSASFNIPASASGSHKVEASDGTNKDSANFTISATASISQTTGNVGDEVTFSGTGFQANQSITITFYNENIATAATDNYGNFSASFTVPALTAGTYQVKVSDGINTKEAYFEIHTSASISPVTSPASPGYVGTRLTISGIGFMVSSTVTITYDGTQVATATVNPDGTFSTPFNAPASSGGEHIIIATDGTTTKQFTFVMESTPPSTVYPQLPLMDSKLKEWKFDWCGDATDLSQEVTDDSLPITYTLQVATEENFAEDSIVLEKTGLTQSEYTITKEERLNSVSKENPYYWRVKAVDAASNESWSGTGSFYVGFSWSLSQPVIYTLFGIGALLLGGLGFWLGRKTAYL